LGAGVAWGTGVDSRGSPTIILYSMLGLKMVAGLT
jgi:hypothetical protein